MLISHNLRRNAEGARITLMYKVQFLCGPFLDGYKNKTDTTDIVNAIKSTTPQCMVNIFMGGRSGGWEGGRSERYLKWGGGH